MTKMRLTARRTEAEVTIDNLNAKTSQGLYCLKLNRLIIIHLSHSQHGHSRSSESCPKRSYYLLIKIISQ